MYALVYIRAWWNLDLWKDYVYAKSWISLTYCCLDRTGLDLMINRNWPREWLGAEQAIAHYLNQWWPSSITPHIVTGPQCVKWELICTCKYLWRYIFYFAIYFIARYYILFPVDVKHWVEIKHAPADNNATKMVSIIVSSSWYYRIDNKPILVRLIAWRRKGDKPSHEREVTQFNDPQVKCVCTYRHFAWIAYTVAHCVFFNRERLCFIANVHNRHSKESGMSLWTQIWIQV